MKVTTHKPFGCWKDIVWRKEVPAQDLVGEGQVALEHGRHLGAEVLPPAEFLQDFHRQQEDLTEVFFLQ